MWCRAPKTQTKRTKIRYQFVDDKLPYNSYGGWPEREKKRLFRKSNGKNVLHSHISCHRIETIHWKTYIHNNELNAHIHNLIKRASLTTNLQSYSGALSQHIGIFYARVVASSKWPKPNNNNNKIKIHHESRNANSKQQQSSLQQRFQFYKSNVKRYVHGGYIYLYEVIFSALAAEFYGLPQRERSGAELGGE